MKPIEERIMAEAQRRASAKLEGVSVLRFLSGLNLDLDPQTTLTLNAPHKNGRHNITYDARLSVTLAEFEESFRDAIMEALSRKIAEELTEQFVAKTASLDVATL